MGILFTHQGGIYTMDQDRPEEQGKKRSGNVVNHGVIR
jgi:hypothetical protein